MPRPITIFLNTDQSRKTVFLLPDNEPDVRSRIIKEAQNKFRVKGINTIYLPGGVPFEDNAFPPALSSCFVGKGEPFVGRVAGPSTAAARQPAEIRLFAQESYIDEKAIAQMKAVAALEGVLGVCGMPDLHPGDRFPIGCTMIAEGIYPALIGSDIGCGIALYELSSKRLRLASQPKRLAEKLRGLDDPWDGSVAEWLGRYGLEHHDRWKEFDQSLGTVGLGNHFVEICSVEAIADEAVATELGIGANSIYLLVHSGSRGLGAAILADARKTENNPYIRTDSPDLEAYLADHDYAVKWAAANRDLLAHRVLTCLKPASSEAADEHEVGSSIEGESLRKILDITHNSVTRAEVERQDLPPKVTWIHRKGVAPARGVVPCAGSRGACSWLFKAEGDGRVNGFSLPHGAGRRYPRQAMHDRSKASKSSLHTTELGSEVVCTDPDLLIEEQPEAYKDMDCIVEDVEGFEIGKGVVKLRPIVTYKVREGGERRK
ncbi:release factor H-coupled R [Schizopora paradoxa]|uniref:3'-phosphate/5'-hydroxy nucleic acid ligase n=1 Tax=Schizopora paradoxa TaxID=27342 RepID=A0A0H2RFU4_9AGAM|nr:release factor H-coupled R [Schizopora paradoxa]